MFTTSADLFSTSHHENIGQCGKCKKKKKKVKQLSHTSAEQTVCKCMLARCYISIWLDIMLLYLSRLVFKSCRWWDFFAGLQLLQEEVCLNWKHRQKSILYIPWFCICLLCNGLFPILVFLCPPLLERAIWLQIPSLTFWFSDCFHV